MKKVRTWVSVGFSIGLTPDRSSDGESGDKNLTPGPSPKAEGCEALSFGEAGEESLTPNPTPPGEGNEELSVGVSILGGAEKAFMPSCKFLFLKNIF